MAMAVRYPVRYSQFHHISEITDSLFLTSAYGASSPTALCEKGITCVINATLSSQCPTPNYKDIDFVRIPVDDDPSANLSAYFDKVADKIWSVKKNGGRCLVHCHAGRSRSASLVMGYLMKYENMTLKRAHEFVKGRRPVIHPNSGFWKQMVSYEQKLKGQSTVKMVHCVHSSTEWIPDIYIEDTQVPEWTF